MTNPNTQQAREWAESRATGNYILSEETKAAVKVIQSLPDHWIDAEKVREVLAEQYMKLEGSDTKWINAATIEALITPSLPTLAEMTPEERKACKDMQAKTWHEVGIIVWVCELTKIAQIITRANGVLERKFEDVTPLPDLPKLEWPGSHADTIIAESVEDMQAGRVADFEPAPPRPEDVHAGEQWLVKWAGAGFEGEWIGTRSSNPNRNFPWTLTLPGSHDRKVVEDSEVTLVSRLVPETPRKEGHHDHTKI